MNNIRAAQDRFLARRFGVLNCFLYGNPGDGVEETRNAQPLDWDQCIA